jgi:hypothetical protein
VSAGDPLNLVGILTQHARVPSTASNSIVWCNGQPAAAIQAGDVLHFTEIGDRERERVDDALGVVSRRGGDDLGVLRDGNLDDARIDGENGDRRAPRQPMAPPDHLAKALP